MRYTVTSLCDKDVITVEEGVKIGTVGDVEFDSESGCITTLIICGKPGFFGMVGRTEDVRVNWEDIKIIGDDTILVKCTEIHAPAKGKRGR